MMGYPGIYRGICVNNNDPEGFNRITALVPQVFGNSTSATDWAWPCYPPGWTATPSALVQTHPSVTIDTVDSHGDSVSVVVPAENHALVFVTPNPGDQVWIAFEGGDTEYPIWMGVSR